MNGELSAALSAALERRGLSPTDVHGREFLAEGDAKTLLRLMDALEDHDDVEAVHANFDISEEVMEKALA